ncbi:NAD-dependent epimerase/dehydratase family protein, partial [Candidatus Woesebacteria bacterium]|nr:NAD-dependent epimerase/dehydratase family protein [Candidatus Woesebacteria bacterium]
MILVTGGCGYIGSHIVKLLSESGEQVVVFDNLSQGSKSALLNGQELVVGDIRD